MKLPWSCLFIAVALCALSGCGKKEITSLQRKQAANFASEAQFAVTIRDFARAEGLLAQATSLCPDTGSYWVDLGTMRVKLGRKDAARDAYKRALQAYEDAERKRKTESEPALRQVYVLALLGRPEDARGLLGKLQKRYPNDREVRVFVEQKQLDRLLADPNFKQYML